MENIHSSANHGVAIESFKADLSFPGFPCPSSGEPQGLEKVFTWKEWSFLHHPLSTPYLATLCHPLTTLRHPLTTHSLQPFSSRKRQLSNKAFLGKPKSYEAIPPAYRGFTARIICLKKVLFFANKIRLLLLIVHTHPTPDSFHFHAS